MSVRCLALPEAQIAGTGKRETVLVNTDDKIVVDINAPKIELNSIIQHLVIIKLMEASLLERFDILFLYLAIYEFIYRIMAKLLIIYHY